MFTYLLLALIVMVPLLVPVQFRRYLQENRDATPEQIDRAYSKTFIALFGTLFIALLAPPTGITTDTVKAGFALTLFAVFWVQYDYSRARDEKSKTSIAPTEDGVGIHLKNLLQTLRGIAFLFCLYGCIYFLNVFGLLVFVYMAPLFARILFESSALVDPALNAEIKNIFRLAGAELGHIRLISTQNKRFINAMVCGTKFGFGPFQRTLYVTDSLFSRLEKEEVLAVLRHEAAHFKLSHILKRIIVSAAAYLAALFMVLVPVFTLVSAAILTKFEIRFFLQPLTMLSVVVVFYFFSRIISNAMNRHEHEADLESIKLGSAPDALISALTKITDDSGISHKKQSDIQKLLVGNVHPSLNERIEVIRAGHLPTRQNPYFNAKTVAAYSAMAAFCIYTAVSVKPGSRLNREIASKPEHAEKVSH